MFDPLPAKFAAHRTLSGGSNYDYVFPAKDGGPWTKNDYGNWSRRVFRPACERAGLADVTPFRMRHGYAYLTYRSGSGLRGLVDAIDISPEQAKVMYSRFLSGRRIELPLDPVFEIKQAIKEADHRNNQVKRIGQ